MLGHGIWFCAISVQGEKTAFRRGDNDDTRTAAGNLHAAVLAVPPFRGWKIFRKSHRQYAYHVSACCHGKRHKIGAYDTDIPPVFQGNAPRTVNADVIDNGGGITNSDALAIQYVESRTITPKDFPMTSEKLDTLSAE